MQTLTESRCNRVSFLDLREIGNCEVFAFYLLLVVYCMDTLNWGLNIFLTYDALALPVCCDQAGPAWLFPGLWRTLDQLGHTTQCQETQELTLQNGRICENWVWLGATGSLLGLSCTNKQNCQKLRVMNLFSQVSALWWKQGESSSLSFNGHPSI